MKTNLVKTSIVALVISFALTSCENDTLNEMETKKVNLEQIKPIDNHNDRELERDLLKKLPIRKDNKLSPIIPSNRNEDQNDRDFQTDELKNKPVRQNHKYVPNRPNQKVENINQVEER